MLGDGRILEKGSFETLRSQNGFVSKLLLHPEIIEPIVSIGIPSVENAKEAPAPVPKALKGPSAADVADLTRQIGDTSVYLYYFRTIGWRIAIINISSSFFFALGTKFPGEL